MPIRTACLLWFSQNSGVPGDEDIAALAKHDVVYLWQFTDAQYVDGVLDLSWTDAIAARIRAVNPRTRIGLYGGPTALVTSIDPGYHWFADAELFHDANGSPLVYHQPDPSHPQQFSKFPNLLDETIRTKLVTRWCDLLDAHGFDALMLDAFSPDYYATLIRDTPANGGYFGLPNGIEQGWRMDTDGWWQVVLTLLGDQLHAELEKRGKSVLVVGLYPLPYDPSNPTSRWLGYGNSNIVKHASGAIIEHCVQGYGNPAAFRDILKTIKLATDKHREVFVYALPWMLDQHYPTQDSPAFRRWCLATYLLIQEAPHTSFGYSDQIPFRGWLGGDVDGPGDPYVFWGGADWERDYGWPLEPYQSDNDAAGAPKLVWRSYTTGVHEDTTMIAVVNPTTSAQVAAFGGTWRVWDRENGQVVSGPPITIPARTGWVLWRI